MRSWLSDMERIRFSDVGYAPRYVALFCALHDQYPELSSDFWEQVVRFIFTRCQECYGPLPCQCWNDE